MKPHVTGIILAGGENRRFFGQNKSFLEVGELVLIDRVLAVITPLMKETAVITNDPLAHLYGDTPVFTDVIPVRGSLSGLYTGLFYADTDMIFALACDAPFPQPALISALIDEIEDGVDIIVPRHNKGYEALFALYSKRCLHAMEQAIRRGRLRIGALFSKLRVKTIDEAMIRRHDPHMRSFVNVNTPAELDAARRMDRRENEDIHGHHEADRGGETASRF